MRGLFWLLVGLTIVVLYRTEFIRFLQRFKKYRYLFLCLLLVQISYLIIIYDAHIHSLIVFFQYNIHSFRNVVFSIMHHVISFQNLEVLTDLTVRLVVLAYCIFYPYYYKKKYNNFAYKSQIRSMNMIHAFLALVFCMIFACLGI